MVFGQLLNSVFGVSKEAVYQKVKDNLLGGYDNLEDVVDDIATDVTDWGTEMGTSSGKTSAPS